MHHVFSVDVEDYFHVEAFSDIVPRSAWETYVCRVEPNTQRILELLDRHNTKATFFVLGWVAERYPGLVRQIAAAGHELACHSYWHRLIYALDPSEFRADTIRAKDLIEQAAGRAIYGYRAPSYSITAKSLWALDILADLGFTYDSSIFPIRHDVYGIPDAPRAPFRIHTASGPLVEYPITTFRLGAYRNMPVGGGGYLRIFPYWYTSYGVSKAGEDGLPLILYIHPWEVDPEQPRLPGRFKSRLRHYTNLSKTYARLDKLLTSRPFTSFSESPLAAQAAEVQNITSLHTASI